MNMMSISIPADMIFQGDIRLDATYYESSVFKAKAALRKYEKAGGKLVRLADFSKGTFNPPPIKRAFTDDREKGTPYMLPQEMYDFYWKARKFVLVDKMDRIEDWYLKNGWVVLSQSGTVGKPYFVTELDENVVLSQNAIRLTCQSPFDGGFIYAYLATWVGQTLLKKDEFGITVKHIRPHQVDEVPIPEANPEIRRRIGNKIQKAYKLRAEAIGLINEAKKEICELLGVDDQLPDEDDEDEE